MSERAPDQHDADDRTDDRSDNIPLTRDVDAGPSLDEAGGIHRDERDPRRSGAAPVRQNDRTRDRQLDEQSKA
jgi:hypothetical protein